MSSSNKKHELDRRSILKSMLMGAGLTSTGALSTFLSSMSLSTMQKAYAQAAGDESAFQDLKLISIVMANGAPRYYWDLPLKPNDGDTFIQNPMCITRLNNSGVGEYATTKINGVNMSSIWSGNIPTPTGSVAMKELAKHMLTIRGIDLQIDSHEIDRFRQMAPVPGGISLSGLVADAATTPIPAIGRGGGNSYYKGEKGIAYLDMSGGNPFTTALTPFSKQANMLSLNNGQVEQAIDQAINRMLALAPDKNKYLASTYAARYNAKKMMLREFTRLQEQFNELKLKYMNLMSAAFSPHLVGKEHLRLTGIDDKIIVGDKSAQQRLTETTFYSGEDLRTLTNNNTYIDGLADGLAVCEFMLLNNLSSSANIVCGNIMKGAYDSFYNPTNKTYGSANGANGTTITVDAHFTGANSALILFSRYYRALSACLYEMTETLKAKKVASGGTLFDRTVMTVTSEFNRLPRLDGSGADHGWQGSNYTVFSGAIDELMVCGNVKSNGDTRGTWGLSAGLDYLNGREAIIGNAASSVSEILEIKTPTPNDMSFVKKVNGKVKLLNKSLKNVA